MALPPRFLFTSGRLCIDFVHTGGEGVRARWERWHSTRDLADWMAQRPGLEVVARVGERDLRDARALREAIWSAAQAVLRRRAIPADCARALVRTGGRPSLVPVLRRGAMAWSPDSTGAQVLSTVARDAIELFGTSARVRLRECGNPMCQLLFVDTSRPGKRAWCTMRRCGNLAKVARYRASRRRSDRQ